MSPRDFKSWMWAEACEMVERADRVHRQYFRCTLLICLGASHHIYETPHEIKIIIALPGVEPEQTTVRLEG